MSEAKRIALQVRVGAVRVGAMRVGAMSDSLNKDRCQERPAFPTWQMGKTSDCIAQTSIIRGDTPHPNNHRRASETRVVGETVVDSPMQHIGQLLAGIPELRPSSSGRRICLCHSCLFINWKRGHSRVDPHHSILFRHPTSERAIELRYKCQLRQVICLLGRWHVPLLLQSFVIQPVKAFGEHLNLCHCGFR